MQLPVGAMVDRWGPGLPYAGALILATLVKSLFAIAESIQMAYAKRILIGVSSAFGWVAALKVIAERFPPDRFAMMSGAGMFIGLCGVFFGSGDCRQPRRRLWWAPDNVGCGDCRLITVSCRLFIFRKTPRGERGGRTEHARNLVQFCCGTPKP